jgi:hypothetical protein
MSDDAQTFRTVLGVQATGRRELALPFDPAEVWGLRDRYHVTGTIDGNPVRGPLSSVAGGWVLPVGALWCQDPRFTEPTEVAAELRLEGPSGITWPTSPRRLWQPIRMRLRSGTPSRPSTARDTCGGWVRRSTGRSCGLRGSRS